MKLNKELFYKSFKQTPQLDFLLDKLDNSTTITRLSWYAYILATIEHETAGTFKPVVEGYWIKTNRENALYNYYLRNNKGAIKSIFPNTQIIKQGNLTAVYPINPMYYGRGLVQVTHIWNYEKFDKILNIPLLEKPELANEPETAWKILEIGMVQGLYTGKKLADYLNDKGLDFYSARRIINGVDRASQIAGRADKYFNALEWIEQAKAENGIDRYVGEAKP